MSLTAKQRNALPASAFIDRRRRRFPVPTAKQARRAGIPEAQRVRTLRNALSRAAQHQKRGAKHVTPTAARSKVKARAGGKVASVKQPARRSSARRGRR